MHATVTALVRGWVGGNPQMLLSIRWFSIARFMKKKRCMWRKVLSEAHHLDMSFKEFERIWKGGRLFQSPHHVGFCLLCISCPGLFDFNTSIIWIIREIRNPFFAIFSCWAKGGWWIVNFHHHFCCVNIFCFFMAKEISHVYFTLQTKDHEQ